MGDGALQEHPGSYDLTVRAITAKSVQPARNVMWIASRGEENYFARNLYSASAEVVKRLLRLPAGDLGSLGQKFDGERLEN